MIGDNFRTDARLGAHARPGLKRDRHRLRRRQLNHPDAEDAWRVHLDVRLAPVGKQPPTTKVNFTSTVSQQAVDKVDLLFAIDNSASMGDKQQYLAEAIPDLITRLVTPNCVDDAGGLHGHAALDGTCSTPGATAEFPPEFVAITTQMKGFPDPSAASTMRATSS